MQAADATWSLYIIEASDSSFYTGIIATLCYETIYPRLAAIAVPTQSAMVRGIFSSGVDNFLHVPFLYMPVFYFWTCIARGGSLEGAKRDLGRRSGSPARRGAG